MSKVIVLFSIFVLLFVPGTLFAGGFDRWTSKTVKTAVQEAEDLKTLDDADFWARMRVAPLYHEYFFPKVGKVEKKSYYGARITIRDYGRENFLTIAENIVRMMKTLEEVHKRLPVHGYEYHVDHLKRMLAGIQKKSTPEYRYKIEALKKGIKFVEENY